VACRLPLFAGHLLEVRPGRVDPETEAQGRALKNRTTAHLGHVVRADQSLADR
jgi:hypothetical protein